MRDPERLSRRYFATIEADDGEGLQRLSRRGLDLFRTSAQQRGAGAAVDGHVSADEALALVDDGYTVTLRPAAETAPLQVAGSLHEWADAQGLDLSGIQEVER